jgi:lipid A 3-O-deacylase
MAMMPVESVLDFCHSLTPAAAKPCRDAFLSAAWPCSVARKFFRGVGEMIARPRARCHRWWLIVLCLAMAATLAPAAAPAQNLTYGELKLGVLQHDPRFLGGIEKGIDINPEVIFPSPIPDAWVATLPWYLGWMVQPRPTLGGEFNTRGFTNQYYFGATWTWQLASNVLRPGDGITFGIFWGPGFNDGQTVPIDPTRKALGNAVLFREAFELGYRINPVWQISAYSDHVSNAGLARYNQSLNEVGGRIGMRF